ncbi:MAG: DUF1553 domain-containing protein [Planctomycetales bacterium]|nr:DUF1553 domain-containing protein [Planctomycetales bacterium]
MKSATCTRRWLLLDSTVGLLMTLAGLVSPFAGAVAAELDLSTLEKIEVQPAEVRFSSPRGHAILLVTGHLADGQVMDLTREAKLVSTNEAVVVSHSSAIWPAGNGSAEVSVLIADQQVIVPVSVEQFDQPSPISFRTETVAALTRQGCNSGGCHGSPSGKGGFLLSLEAYDNAMDEQSLTRGAQGRRTNRIEPDQSLLLLKPTMTVEHGGGLKLNKNDYSYEVLRQWIAEGISVDSVEGKRCVELELLPASGRVLKHPHLKQQIVALAHFEDGTVRDVTRLTKFSSSDEEVATISADGLLRGQSRGQVAVMARYLDQLVSCQLTLVRDVEGFQWPDPPANNYVDEAVYEKLRQLQYPPSELCTDSDFIRRVYLDVIGVLPTLAELDAFLGSEEANRRQVLIDQLLERPEFARFWALKWGDLLRLQEKSVNSTGVPKFYQWLVDAFEQNMPFDQFARELLTAQGSTYDHPAANYYRAAANMSEATETTAQLFLGSRIQCAKCHNHPFENWTQDNYYGLNAFFNRVARKPGKRFEEEVVFVSREGEVQQPRTGQTMKPWLPGQGVVEEVQSHDRRSAFVDWLTAPQNPFFARVAVNRIWSEVTGQGIVEPVDDFRQSNPPANEVLLEKLAADFVAHGYDQKHILRTILNSRTYQLSSEANELNSNDKRLFSHAKMRMLSAEQLLDAVCQVTQLAETFPGLPAGTRATAIPSPDFAHTFLDTFGRPARTTACACERSDDSTLAQAIQLFNGSMIHQKLADKQNRFHKSLSAEKTPEVILGELYRAALSRPPTAAEAEIAMKHIAAKETPGEGLEDLCWVLFNSDEFLTQH